jgi:NTP pyrophosphatase (non-canonical NTP hydrolase)
MKKMDDGKVKEASEKIFEILRELKEDPVLRQYQQACNMTAKKDFASPTEEIMCWGLGVSGEAGDVAGCIKKTFAHKNDQKEGIRENIGDTLWYMAMICNFFDWSLQDILSENLEKLKKRYPDGFTETDAARGNTRVDWNL